MVDGTYSQLKKDKLKNWISTGGNVIAIKKAAIWLADNEMSKLKFKENVVDSTKTDLPYNAISKYKGAQIIGGAIFGAKMDLTHPVCFGFLDDRISVFRNSTLFIEMVKNPYANPVKYNSNPLQSGYISKENNAKIEGTACIGVSILGKEKLFHSSTIPTSGLFGTARTDSFWTVCFWVILLPVLLPNDCRFNK